MRQHLRSTNYSMNSSNSIIMLNGTSSNKSLKSSNPCNEKINRKDHSYEKIPIDC